uniref:RNase H type-1 domain-containing protein n=1 Tax=Arion vulgaris TaxID=1028688 RepID=A0A0B7AIM6_9EUPU
MGSGTMFEVAEEVQADKNHLFFVPWHADVRGNERTDRLASMAAVKKLACNGQG